MLSPGIVRILRSVSFGLPPIAPTLVPASAAFAPTSAAAHPSRFRMRNFFAHGDSTSAAAPSLPVSCVDIRCEDPRGINQEIKSAAQSVVRIDAHRMVTEGELEKLRAIAEKAGKGRRRGQPVDIQEAALAEEPAPETKVAPAGEAPQKTRRLGWSGSGAILKPSVLHENLVRHLPSELVKGHPEHVYLIMTNHHVANQAEKIVVTLADGKEVEATPLRSPVNGALVMDPVTDTAFLVINDGRILPTLEVASGETLHDLQATETVFAVGHPLGLPGVSITQGIITQPWQSTGTHPYPTVQSDFALNPGNSGGPLLNGAGILIGINTFKLNGENMNYAIPANLAVLSALNVWVTGSSQWSALPVAWAPFPLEIRQSTGFDTQVTGRSPRINHGAGVAQIFSGSTGTLQPGDVVTYMRPRFGEIGAALRRTLKQFPWLAKRGKANVRFSHPAEISDLMGRFLPLPPGTLVKVWFFRPTVTTDAAGNRTVAWGKIQTGTLSTVRLPTDASDQDDDSGAKPAPDDKAPVPEAAAALAWNASANMFVAPLPEWLSDKKVA